MGVRTTDEFIRLANIKHNNKYIYNKVVYVEAHTKVTIVCKDHGEFAQTPNQHLRGRGCRVCAKNKPLTTEEFITRARALHGSKYDYSLTSYINSAIKVDIICQQHGKFSQIPNHHLRGIGCPKCGGTGKLDVTEFIDKANEKHNFKYDYSKVEYITSRDRVIIVCGEHGEFSQIPNSHLSGRGCTKCKNSNATLKISEFIDRSNEVHNNKYDYSKCEYKLVSVKVTIICPEHGVFQQVPMDHMRGRGCKLCSKTTYNPNKEGHFYIFVGTHFVGFGITNVLNKRLLTHRRTFKKNKIQAILFKTYAGKGADIFNLEYEVKYNFKNDIVDTGLDGFRTEALNITKLQELISFCDSYLDSL